MSEQQQRPQNVRPSNASSLIVRVNPNRLETSSFRDLVESLRAELNVADVSEQDKVLIDQLNRLTNFEAQLKAKFVQSRAKPTMFMTTPQQIMAELKTILKQILNDASSVVDKFRDVVLNGKFDSDTDQKNSFEQAVTTTVTISNMMFSLVSETAIETANLLNANLPPEKASRTVNHILSGYEIWKPHRS